MTEYDNSGNIVYKGGFIDDISKDYPREGKGREFVGGVVIYIGEWKNNKRDGKGKTLKDGFAEYEGGWKEGLPNGLGLLNKDGKSYKGNWDMGKLKMDNGETYNYVGGQTIPLSQPKLQDELKVNKGETNDSVNEQIVKNEMKQSEPLSQQSQTKPFITTVKMVIVSEVQLRELLTNENEKRIVKKLVIAEGIGNGMKDDLELCGFENLESLVVKKNALKCLKSLKISDNPVLKSIETEDGERLRDNGKTDSEDVDSTGAFFKVKSVTITSTLIDD